MNFCRDDRIHREFATIVTGPKEEAGIAPPPQGAWPWAQKVTYNHSPERWLRQRVNAEQEQGSVYGIR